TINEKIGFGAGDMAIAIVMMSLAMIITYFYTDVFGLKPVDLGILLFSVRILDAVIDPVVGTMTDITNTRWGKYRPWPYHRHQNLSFHLLSVSYTALINHM
ncbi:MFS transporter, partial [Escherichia sp. HC-CC]